MVGSLIWVAAWMMPTTTPTTSMASSSGPPTQRATSRPRRSSVRASSGVMGMEMQAWCQWRARLLSLSLLPWLLLFLPVKRTEHRSDGGGVEARLSERSELRAVPRWREKRRVPASAAGRIAVPAVLSFWLLFLCTSKEKVTRPGCAAAGETCLDLVGGL